MENVRIHKNEKNYKDKLLVRKFTQYSQELNKIEIHLGY